MIRRRLRWRKVLPGEVETICGELVARHGPTGGEQRHMFPLSAIESYGAEPVRLASDGRRWALAVVFPGRLLVPCGDAEAIRAAGLPVKRWRLLVGDAAAGDAVLSQLRPDPTLRVLSQRYLVVEPDRVPDAAQLADPGLRRAEPADLDALARLAVRLHIDDGFGPDPGAAGLRGYRDRLATTVRQGNVYCVGPVGRPVLKLERSVSSQRWGVQLAGIVADPAARGQGLGRAAVATAVRAALREGGRSRAVTLHVRDDNLPALRAYDAAGFVDREAWRLAVRS